ncbi:MAG TPA: methyl-accepting chemotaxis protein [Opitutaceae bacterium]|nr:methyl-accepting chemotaxis protein [Opitutaceae bacterium]
MNLRWTFGQKIAAGFAVVLAFTIVGSLVSIRALRTVTAEYEQLLAGHVASLADAAKFQGAMEFKVAAFRGFLLTGKEDMVRRQAQADAEVSRLMRQLHSRARPGESVELLQRIERAYGEHAAAANQASVLRQGGTGIDQVARMFDETVAPRRVALDELVDAFVAREERALESARAASAARTASALRISIGLIAATVLAAVVFALVLSRQLGRDIGTAIQHIRSASAELQSAASQQATGAKETATSMNEISTTVSELLATSRQIAESAQRVAQIAEGTAGAARSGDRTVQAAHESITGIKQQVDHVVTNMLDLGRKSQQIGGVVEIINELAEQTNILSINASIEAAGAGESGRRFAIVADEIRKLAERTGGSTREISAIIEEIRAAVNTTVMATEGGAKAVDAGTRQFAEVAAAFDQIVKLVSTSTEAAREIELSTKQQTTAVEQVNIAIVNAAQATKETEASSSQTLQTAGQLASLSDGLARLV